MPAFPRGAVIFWVAAFATAFPVAAEIRHAEPKPKPSSWTIAKSSSACPHGDAIHAQWNVGPHGVQKRFVSAYRLDGLDASFYESSLDIDVDGSPQAYHPPLRGVPSGHPPGLDRLANAGYPNSCNVLFCKKGSSPPAAYAITKGGPYDGFYVSKSSLRDRRKVHDKLVVPGDDYRAYVDATAVPYIAVAGKALGPMKLRNKDDEPTLGVVALVVDLATGKSTSAIFADGGTNNTLGEGSVRLARALGYSETQANPQGSTIEGGILTVVFPGSAATLPWPRELSDIDKDARERFKAWGGMARVKACFPASHVAG